MVTKSLNENVPFIMIGTLLGTLLLLGPLAAFLRTRNSTALLNEDSVESIQYYPGNNNYGPEYIITSLKKPILHN